MIENHTPALESVGPTLLKELVKAGTVERVSVQAAGSDFTVYIHFGKSSLPLATFRGNVRNFKTIQTVLTYLHEMGVHHFEVDTTFYPQKPPR